MAASNALRDASHKRETALSLTPEPLLSQDLEVFHANLASHAAGEPTMRAVLARRRAAGRTREAELGLEYRWHFERLRQRADGACLVACTFSAVEWSLLP